MSNAAVAFTITAIDQTRAAFASVEAKFASLQATASKLNSLFLPLFGVGMVAGVAAWAKSAIDAADALNTVSERTGIAVEQLNGISYAFEQAGGSADDAADAIKKLSQTIGDAGRGDKNKVALLKSLGLEEAAKGAEDALVTFRKLADIWPRLTPPQQASVGADILGKSWERSAALLNKGSEYIKKLEDDGRRLRPITDSLAKSADELGDSWSRLKMAASSSAIPALESLLPKINAVTNAMIEARLAGNGMLESISQGLKRGIAAAVGQNAEDELGDVRKRIAEAKALRDQPGGIFGGGIAGAAVDKQIASLERYEKTLSGIAKQERDYRDMVPGINQSLENYGKPKIKVADSGGGRDKIDEAARRAKKAEEERLARSEKSYYERVDAIEEQYFALGEVRRQERMDRDKELKSLSLLEERSYYERVAAIEEEYYENGQALARANIEARREAERQADRTGRDIGLVFTSSAQEALRNWKSVGDLLRSIGQDMLALIYKRAVAEPMGDAISSVFKSSGASKAISGFWDWLIPKAEGGPTFAGSAYLVGERGPELFVPQSAGTIVPNGAGGTYYIDARGAAPRVHDCHTQRYGRVTRGRGCRRRQDARIYGEPVQMIELAATALVAMVAIAGGASMTAIVLFIACDCE
jgi:hypothetical protein